MNNIDKWCAEQCGVEIHNHQYYLAPPPDAIGYAYWHKERWTIQDPRCREIVREKFKMQTRWIGGNTPFEAYCENRESLDIEEDYWSEGKTIAEAEIQCIEAIYEARDGNTKD